MLVWILQHTKYFSTSLGDVDAAKFLGAYSDKSQAEIAKSRFADLPSYKNYLGGFSIDSYTCEDTWNYGFIEIHSSEQFIESKLEHEPQDVKDLLASLAPKPYIVELHGLYRGDDDYVKLMDVNLPTNLQDIIEKAGLKFGGGRYKIKVFDSLGKLLRSSLFEIAGLPKCQKPI